MKNIFIFLLVLATSFAFGQTMEDYISKAKSAYSSENYEAARMNLQNALTEIDKLIAKEILKALPSKLGALSSNPDKDSSTGTGSTMLGLYVSRYYGSEEGEHAEVTIADNSPFMGMVSTFLNNPMLSGLAGMAEDQKVVRVDGYKGMLQLDEEEGTYSLMIPFGDSLFSMDTNIKDETKVMSMANQVSISSIVAIVD